MIWTPALSLPVGPNVNLLRAFSSDWLSRMFLASLSFLLACRAAHTFELWLQQSGGVSPSRFFKNTSAPRDSRSLKRQRSRLAGHRQRQWPHSWSWQLTWCTPGDSLERRCAEESLRGCWQLAGCSASSTATRRSPRCQKTQPSEGKCSLPKNKHKQTKSVA